MTDPSLPHGKLPPIPDGCGILPIAENRIVRGPQPELLDAVPEGYALTDSAPLPVLNDALEQSYRRVLSRAFALAACALLLGAAFAMSLVDSPALHHGILADQMLFRVILLAQIVVTALCSRYVERLAILPATILLFAYAAFTALEFSVLLSPKTLATILLCAALMYGATSAWGFVRRADLARPITVIFMILAGGVILVVVNSLLQTSRFVWGLCSIEVVIFAVLAGYHAQEIRDFYQDFDDDNAEGWKASVLGALLLLINSVNIYLLAATFLGRFFQDDGDRTDEVER